MNIDIKDIPSPSKLIATMDEHPVGAVLFVLTLLILLVGVAGACGCTSRSASDFGA